MNALEAYVPYLEQILYLSGNISLPQFDFKLLQPIFPAVHIFHSPLTHSATPPHQRCSIPQFS